MTKQEFIIQFVMAALRNDKYYNATSIVQYANKVWKEIESVS